MAQKIEIIRGQKFSYLTVIREGKRLVQPSGQTNRTARCKCKCGKIKNIRLIHLRTGRVKSCGCWKNVKNRKSSSDIGILLNSIIWRCSENYTERKYYFDKGIKVCDEWLNDIDSFENWCLGNGYEKGLQIDREDNSKGYSPDNCRFVTSKINNNNRDNTVTVNYENEEIQLQILIDRLNIKTNRSTINARLKRGWKLKDALFKPVRK